MFDNRKVRLWPFVTRIQFRRKPTTAARPPKVFHSIPDMHSPVWDGVLREVKLPLRVCPDSEL
jgi:hypothetical protein